MLVDDAPPYSVSLGALGQPPLRPDRVVLVAVDVVAAMMFKRISQRGKPVKKPKYPGSVVDLPDGTFVGLRPTSNFGYPTIDIKFPGSKRNLKIKFIGE